MITLDPGTRSSIGAEPPLVAALSYVLGLVSGIAVLLLEKENRFVRFHAMQSTLTFAGVMVVAFILPAVPVIRILYVPFVVAVAALWILLMFKALQGQAYKLPYIGDLAEQQVR